MKTVLVISSFVAASHVGANVSAFCLRRLGYNVIVLPTTLMGRHPGWGDPGGSAVDQAALREMWAAIKDQAIHIDAVLSGYMGAQDHIPLTASIINHVKIENPEAIILVDPVMGDNGRLYVPETRADAIKNTLAPLADILTPNIWELSYLTGLMDVTASVQKLETDVLVTSLLRKTEIGAALFGKTSGQVYHPQFEKVPHGGGDALASLFLAHLLSGKDKIAAMRLAVSGVFAMMEMASTHNLSELPIVDTQDEWAAPDLLDIERL